jgi:hypothetical protein
MQWEDSVASRHVTKTNTASSNSLNRSNHSNFPSVNARIILKYKWNIQSSEGYELAPFGSGKGQCQALVEATVIILVLRKVTASMLVPLFDSQPSIKFADLLNLFPHLFVSLLVSRLVR